MINILKMLSSGVMAYYGVHYQIILQKRRRVKYSSINYLFIKISTKIL